MKTTIQRKTNYLKFYRKKIGYSQKEVACLMGHKTTTHVSNYERGKKLPDLNNLLKLEIILRTPVAFLFRDQYLQLRRELRAKEAKPEKNLREKPRRKEGHGKLV